MKRIAILSLLLCCCLFSCEDDAQRGRMANEQNLSNNLGAATNEQPTEAPAPSQAPLTLAASSPSVAPGEEVCVEVMVEDFYNLLSMQYTMKWDPAVLTYSDIKGFNLPYLSKNNFGAHRTAEGLLTFVWIDDALKGKTLTNGSQIFQICFTATGEAGQSSAFEFVDQPTPFEVVNEKTQVIPLRGVAGKVTIRE